MICTQLNFLLTHLLNMIYFFHRDWKQMFGNSLIEDIKFKYNDINFLEIANASRN